MFRTALTNAALATLITLYTVGLAAADPPGYERLVAPDGKTQQWFNIPVTAGISGNLNSDIWGTEGFRPVDVEVNGFDAFVDYQNELEQTNSTISHEISFVEVPNEGPLEEAGWVMELAASPESILFTLENVNARPIDVELYFRTESDIDGKVFVPRCACIWVPNVAPNESDWDFIPPMPADALMNLLEAKYDQGWRPYDVEFAVHKSGDVFGTALLAPIVSTDVISGTQWVATEWGWFNDTQLEAETAAGWQVLDFELAPAGVVSDPLVSNPDQFDGAIFCVLVFQQYLWQFPDTQTQILFPLSPKEVGNLSNDMAGQARLVDLEMKLHKGGCSGKLCEGDVFNCAGAWLFQ